jgi:CRISPR/Cas system-associated protein endoribonuclease Cas2
MAKKLIDGKEVTFEAVIPMQVFSKLNPWQALKAMFGVRVCVYAQIFVNRKCTVMHRRAISYMEDEPNPGQEEAAKVTEKELDKLFSNLKNKK